MKLILILIVINFYLIQSARILTVVPTPSLSHNLFYRPLILELTKRGHEVVSITSDPINQVITNLTEIDVHNETYGTLNFGEFFLKIEKENPTPLEVIKKMVPQMNDYLFKTLTNQAVKEVLDQKFDLVMIEHFCYPILFGLKPYFNSSLISMMSMEMMVHSYDSVGNPTFPSYFIDLWHESGMNLNFLQRLKSFIYAFEYRWYYSRVVREQQKMASALGWNVDLVEAERNVDLIFVNSNKVFNTARPLVPAIVEIGGLHSRESSILPHDLKNFLDDSEEGVVYFALGSNYKSKSLAPGTLDAILTAFKKLPYKVLFKWENNNLPNKTQNIFIQQWLPQQDVLIHPNVVAFVTPGGINSIEESIKAKVPLVCFSTIATDQKYNAGRVEALGIGKRIYFNEISTEVLVQSITEVIENPRYKESITKVSNILWDQPIKPLGNAVWWIEYVIRHGGAQHLRSPGVDQSWFKLLCLDIISLLISLILTVIYIVYKIVILAKNYLDVKRRKIKVA